MSDLKRSDHFHVNFKTNITRKIISTPFSYGTRSQVETYLAFIIGSRANQYLIFRFLSLLKRALYLKVCYVLLDSVHKAFFLTASYITYPNNTICLRNISLLVSAFSTEKYLPKQAKDISSLF